MKRLFSILFLLLTLTGFAQQNPTHKIKKIEFSARAGDWEGCSFSFVIHNNRTVEYTADSLYCKRLGKHQLIDTLAYDSLLTALSKVDYTKWKIYPFCCADCGLDFIQVTYTNRKTKKIQAGEACQPKDMKPLLQFLYKLRDTQHWQ